MLPALPVLCDSEQSGKSWQVAFSRGAKRLLLLLFRRSMHDPIPAEPQTILVVDDNQDIRAFMSAALEGAGYQAHTAAEGAEAMGMLRGRGADLMITDIFMPGQEGFETISRCKAEFPQTRIIVMSAGTVPGMKHDFLASAGLLGAATLRKPFTAGQLLEVVRSVLQTR